MTNKERNKNISHFAELDELAKGSYYVIPQKADDLRMYDLRMYCKTNNIKPENLTEKEVDQFRVHH